MVDKLIPLTADNHPATARTDDANHMVSTYIDLIPDKSNTTNNCKCMIRIRNEQMNLKSNNNNNNGFIIDESNSPTIHAQEIIVWGQFKPSSWGRPQKMRTFTTGKSIR